VFESARWCFVSVELLWSSVDRLRIGCRAGSPGNDLLSKFHLASLRSLHVERECRGTKARRTRPYIGSMHSDALREIHPQGVWFWIINRLRVQELRLEVASLISDKRSDLTLKSTLCVKLQSSSPRNEDVSLSLFTHSSSGGLSEYSFAQRICCTQ
jgi:hypothetical protein